MSIGRHITRLSGYAPAIPTPFNSEGGIDVAAFEQFCGLQIEHGATALVVCGTTGEAPTLTPAEQIMLIKTAAGVARGQVPVIAGAGSNATSHAIELTRLSEHAGADGILSVVPYYNRPTQAGLFEHFSAIARCTALPVILYDVPSRTACGLADDTVARLAERPGIIGLKDATGDVARVARLRAMTPPEFRLLSGDDATALAFLAQGGDGCISVTANVAPGLCRNMFLSCGDGHMAAARRWAAPVEKLTAVLFRESNPAPLKYALSLHGLISARLRLPLVEPTETTKSEIAAVMAEIGEHYPDYLCGDFAAATSPARAAAE